MGKLDDIVLRGDFRYSDGESNQKEVDEAKQQIKDLMLELIDSIEPYQAEDGRGFVNVGELTQKVSDL